MSSTPSEQASLLDKLDTTPLAKFEMLPNIPSTYKAYSESRKFLWGWPDFEFSVDNNPSKYLNINIDLVVAMLCGYLSIDLRDAMADRLFLSGRFRRNGVTSHRSEGAFSSTICKPSNRSVTQLSPRLFDWLLRREKVLFKPMYNYEPIESACRISGTLAVTRVTSDVENKENEPIPHLSCTRSMEQPCHRLCYYINRIRPP
ncbi:hypothetical protein BYT27DRAFT_6379481 [Phlegmacium glaucopus]|nr:hypothetical protein BYT27DRAFT_6379481 [Phlegmacium glaucopus]